MRIIPFLIIYVLQILITFPTFVDTCNNKDINTYLLYFSHHIFDVFIFWSPFFLQSRIDFLLHLLVVIGVAIHWWMNNNTCVLTVIMNRLCRYREDIWLDSLKNRMGIEMINRDFHFIWVGMLAILDIALLIVM